jgi:coenzyme Q-binding protein COQ10
MLIERAGHVLPFTCEQVFDVVADIERYPDFLPGWISASISRREANTCYVEQVLGRGPVRVSFASEAMLQRPERLDITSSDASFRKFTLSMLIKPSVPAGSTLSISAHVALRSLFLQKILSQFVANSIDDVMVAFQRRVHAVYRG